ncbi:SH3 domain-containing protein [Streptomyces sp. NPDC057239]|uniref:SH3 domain-containing protein n=1 Tax=Streptomyces sp. NPDC057239 TaxID=3346061 RepID=UPI0036412494
MSPRPPLTRRLPIALAAGALAVATAVTPAVAADDPNQGGGQGNWSQQGGNGNGNNNQQGGNGNADQQGGGHQQGGGGNGNQQGGNNNQGNQQGGNGNGNQQGGGHQQGGGGNNNQGNQAGGHHQGDQGNLGNQGDQGQYKGVVTANSLALRSAPNRGSQIIRYAHKGDVVSIFCKVPGDKVDHNPLWYLLTDGTWAWGPAAHIDNLGPAPRWC